MCLMCFGTCFFDVADIDFGCWQACILNVATEHPMGNFLTDVRALAAPYFFIKSRTNVLCLRESKNTRNITIETTFLQMFMSVSHTCILIFNDKT